MIYISCPYGQYTGGPTLAHQLCFELIQNKIEAKMFYYGSNKKGDNPVHPNYKHFNNPFVTELDHDVTDVIVILESKISLVSQYPKAKKYIWWMSVDNLFISRMGYYRRLKKKIGMPYIDIEKERNGFKNKYSYIIRDDSILHLYQSEYAKLFLLANGVEDKKIFPLTDYVEEEIFDYARKNSNQNRKDVILYNPKKGFEFTKKIIRTCSDLPYSFIPLVNMTKTEVSSHLCSSKLYIDFGTHPGKDRFPREAVISGCCLITGRRGSANNDIDIPIKDRYKFLDYDDNLLKIRDSIIYVMDNYDNAINDFEFYKKKIEGERDSFINEAIKIFKDI